MNLFEELKERGLISDCTNEEKALFALQNKKRVYLGIDPTFPSLHLGNYLGITVLKRFIKEGHEVIVILGEMTASVGDPSFRDNERVILSRETIKKNLKSIQRQLKRLIPEAKIINNYSFYEFENILDFVNKVFSLVNVNYLLGKEFIKSRLRNGLTLAEFIYPLLQSWDFLKLYEDYQVSIQLGGNDQVGNITFGVELIRKKIGENNSACGITFPLLTDNEGKKFGKSEGNALFLEEEFTSPYKIYQYLLNVDDPLVDRFLKVFTFLELKKIQDLKDPIEKKNILAFQVCKDIYGENVAKKLEAVSNKLFNYNLEVEDFELLVDAIPTYQTKSPISCAEALKKLGLVSSNSEINRLIESKGLFLFNDLVIDSNQIFTREDSRDGYYLIRKGKKTFGLVCFH